MGLLEGSEEKFIKYNNSKEHQRTLRNNAALQLNTLLKKFKNFTKSKKETLKYGTEAETHLLQKKVKNGKTLYTTSTKGQKFIKTANKDLGENLELKEEYADWLIEFMPRKPFSRFLDFEEIYQHFKFANKNLNDNLDENSLLLMGMSTLPNLGTLNYFLPENNRPVALEDRSFVNNWSKSTNFLDETITNHSRFKSLTMNVKNRSGKKPEIRVPVFQDKFTKEKEMVLDHFGFGMGCSAIQITFSCKDMDQARWVYDQMHVFAPFAQTLSNSTGVVNGRLLDWDSRWRLIEQSTDCRKPVEQANIKKGRYAPASFYISNDLRNRKKYNDSKFTLNKKFRKQLKKMFKKEGSEFYKDTRLMNHYAYLFVRECLTVFDSKKIENNLDNTFDFEMIQGTNWNDVRFKPPNSFDSKLGWLMEFRSMDSPITDKETAALVFFSTLMQRMIVDEKLGLNFYVPISDVDKNFDTAIGRDSVDKGKFVFRKFFSKYIHGKNVNKDDKVELTMEEFLMGNGEFAGIKKLIEAFIKINVDILKKESEELGYDIISRIWSVFEFYVARSKGEILSNSAFIKKFVRNHKSYKGDSIVGDEIVTDLIDALVKIQKEDYHVELFGNHLGNF